MKTPFTDASTLMVHAAGKTFPVTPASVSQLLEVRNSALEVSQDIAWGIIKLVDWKTQSPEWRDAARKWQTDVYIHKELPLAFTPGHKPPGAEELPTNLPDALRIIATLREERHRESIRLAQLEKDFDALEKIVNHLESREHELIHITQSLQQN